MSTEPGFLVRAVPLLAGISVVAMATVAATAAEVRFRPTISFGLYHEGNVEVIGNPLDGGDNVANLAADLAVERTTPATTLTFSYRPSYVAYANDTDLNYFGQSADFNFSTTETRTSHYTVSAHAYRSSRQGVRPTEAATPVSLIPLNTTTHFSGSVRGTHQGRRNILDWGIHGDIDDYSGEREIVAGPPEVCSSVLDCDDEDVCTEDSCVAGFCQHVVTSVCELQNSQSLGAVAGWRYEISQNASIGIGVVYDAIFYDDLPDATVASLGIVGAYQFGRATSLSYAAGGSVTSSDDLSSTNFALNVSLARTITDVSTLSAGARQAVTHGSGVGGLSLDSGVFVAYAHSAPRPGITGSVTAAYWRRDPVNFGGAIDTPSTSTVSATGSIGWIFNRYLSLNVVDSYSFQSSSNVATLDTNYNSYGVNLRWDIRGREQR